MHRWGEQRRLGLTATLAVTVTPSLLRRLDAAARARGVTRAALVRAILKEWLDRMPNEAASAGDEMPGGDEH